ncbi:MAG TPA: YetF domain-containing protein [Thermomicrobiaceae bacterium]|nr:YetF domain-containing protein [Thermomicrobiaceae bacterium]
MGITGVGPAMLLALAVRTAIVLGVLIVGVRIFGKRLTGELRTIDILVVLAAANAVQNSMTMSDGHLTVSLVAGGTLIVLGRFVGNLLRARPGWMRSRRGGPVVLVSDGRVFERNLRREGVTDEDLRGAMRQIGLTDVANVRLAVLEETGGISVVPARQPAEA